MKRRGSWGRGSCQGWSRRAQITAGLDGASADSPPALRTQGLVGVELAETVPGWQNPAGGPGEGRRARAAGASGPGAFLRIGLLAQAAAPPLLSRLRPRLEQEPPSSLVQRRCSSGLWERTQPLPSGSFQSHETILQTRKLMRRQPPSAPDGHRAEPAL